ncbi:hypothetical protein SDC9_69774 [bioreactor metagenome]|uniref:Uncharacterized protein n=1 Tax=bioreactor metagenome TaxID=1076179 RepID=A0A644Y9Q8_9ZZZZ
MEVLSKQEVSMFLQEHKEFFHSGKTIDISFRINQLNKLKSTIKKYEKEILEALYKDLKKSEFEAYSTEIGFVLDSIGYITKNLKKW